MTPGPTIQDLIATVVKDAPTGEPLARLSTAAAVMREVTETADAALGHFVDQARRAGHSWSEIGESLGVTKQAAQQRHGARLAGIPLTLERFTDRARNLVALSESLARELGHNYIGTEHLLLAQYSVPEGMGAVVLSEVGLSREAVRAAVLKAVGRGRGAPESQLPFTPRANQLLTATMGVAIELGHNYIGTEHLLLGALRTDGVARSVLREAGVDEDTVRPRVEAHLARIRGARAPGAAGPGQASADRAGAGAGKAAGPKASRKPPVKKAPAPKARPR